MMPTGNPGLMVKTQHSLAASGGGRGAYRKEYKLPFYMMHPLMCWNVRSQEKKNVFMCKEPDGSSESVPTYHTGTCSDKETTS